MWLGIVSLFPAMFQAISEYGITRRAIDSNLLKLAYWNPRDYAEDKHRTVDDRPYGGGPGMLMKVGPLRKAIRAAKDEMGGDTRVIYLSPQGKQLNQTALRELAGRKRMILVAGRYEGIDERIIEEDIDEEYSLGDYVLSGGELPAMVLIDGITRLIPGALGHEDSAPMDSFSNGLLDHPHYTRPEVVDGKSVPEVLLQGDHAAIEEWRLKQSLGRTRMRRPDLIDELDEYQTRLLNEYLQEIKEREDE